MVVDGEAAFRASGCTDMLGFLSTLAPLQWIVFGAGKSIFMEYSGSEPYVFGDVDGLRAQEESREAGSFIRFLTALPSSCPTLSIRADLKLASEHELSALFDAIASPSCTLQSLELRAPITISSSSHSISSAKVLCQSIIGDALCKNTSLTSLSISLDDDMDIIEKHLLPALITRPHSSIKSLSVWLYIPSILALDCLLHILTALALNTASTLNHLEVYDSGPRQAIKYSSDLRTLLGKVLSTNKSLKSFELHWLYLPGTLVHSLFNSLESNVHLTHLSLSGCGGEDWPSASSVLDCLRINASLQELELYETPLAGQKEAAIEAILERNKANEEQFKVLREEHLVQATAVRLFLCGLPYSGKTTLATSLRKWNRTTPPSTIHCLSCATSSNTTLQRTRGIDVSMLEKDGVKVSLWDLAGQTEYLAFHDSMFPNLSSEAAPSLFLFVWNPFELDLSNGDEIKTKHGKSRLKDLHMFKEEFRYWLKFLASKTLSSLKFKPMLLVVITRADRLQIDTRQWVQHTFNQCQEDFKEYIQFDVKGLLFEVDARNPHQVKDLGLHIFHCAQLVLTSAPRVYQECDSARRVIHEMVLKKRHAPMMAKDQFFSILTSHLQITSEEKLQAIALSLNDSGDLIYFKSSDLVVLDTQWFCHHIMGNLLHSPATGSDYSTEVKGFFRQQILENLLESQVKATSLSKYSMFSRRPSPRSPNAQGQTLVKLLIGLHLACQYDNDADIFIPASLCSRAPRHINPLQYLRGKGNIVTYMGRRLKCKDSIRTFFTPGIFPVLQVTFHKTLSETVVKLEEDIIAFSRDGINVFAQFCKPEGQDQFIDVLIHSCLNLDDTIEWVYEVLINEMERVCAQPKGIQGVELTYEVINPLWVEEIKYVGIEERSRQAVSMEDLRGILKRYLDKKRFDPKNLRNVMYTWQATNNSTSVVDLLGNVETLRVIESYQKKFILDVEAALGVNIEKEMCDQKVQEEKVFSASTSKKEIKWVYDEVRELRKDVQRIHEDLQRLSNKMSSLCDIVAPKLQVWMNEMLTFVREGEVGKLPRFFLVTRSDGVGRKIISTMVPGLQNVRLELLCEHRGRLHLVDDQPGLTFATLEDGLLKRGLPYIVTLLKVAQVAMKVGVHVATGLGHTIPDFASVLASIEATPKSPDLPTYFESNSPSNSRKNLQEGQQWLLDVLSQKNCCTSTRIHGVFGLSRVRYPNSQIGWLCDEHRPEGELCPI